MSYPRGLVVLVALVALALAALGCSVTGPTGLLAPTNTPRARVLNPQLRATATTILPTPALDAQVSATSATAEPASASAPTEAPAGAAGPTAAPRSTVTVPVDADAESLILERIYEKVNPSVVRIFNLAHSSNLPSSADAIPQGEGSGFVWDTQGHIVTNNHVVAGAEQLQVFFADGTQMDGELVATDPYSDLAVVKVDPSLVTLVPVEQGDINTVKVGQRAVAIGNPFGFEGTMTQGIVSAIGRSIPGTSNFSIPEAIQTDAAINPGNSGGPLLNDLGQVIGVNAQIQSSTQSNSGVGFAIPINIVQRIAPALIKDGRYRHAYLGIRGGNYTRAWSKALGLPADVHGAYVEEVVRGGPAEQAGLRAGSQATNILLGVDSTGTPIYLQRGGDVIVAVDGKPIGKMDDLLIYLERYTSPGQTVQLSVVRSDGSKATVSVKLGERPQQQGES